jgi:hypothetical protein
MSTPDNRGGHPGYSDRYSETWLSVAIDARCRPRLRLSAWEVPWSRCAYQHDPGTRPGSGDHREPWLSLVRRSVGHGTGTSTNSRGDFEPHRLRLLSLGSNGAVGHRPGSGAVAALPRLASLGALPSPTSGLGRPRLGSGRALLLHPEDPAPGASLAWIPAPGLGQRLDRHRSARDHRRHADHPDGPAPALR